VMPTALLVWLSHKRTRKWPATHDVPVCLGVKHQWVERANRWQCSVCLGTTNNLALSSARKGESCKGRRDVCTATEQPDLGHSVTQFSVGGSLVFVCKHCGNAYRPKRSDQQFCSTSHRAANFQLVKRQQRPKSAVPVSDLSAAPDMPIAKPASVNNPLSPIAAVVGTNLLDQGIQKLAGFITMT